MQNGELLSEMYKSAHTSRKRINIVGDLVDFYTEQGLFPFRDTFWTKLSMEDREQFVEDGFNFLVDCTSAQKVMTLELLEIIYLELTLEQPKLRKKLFSVFYAALFESKNYKLALEALNFFSTLWKNTSRDDPLRQEIFPKLLDFMDNEDPLLAEEGIYETLKLLEDSTQEQKREYFEALLVMGAQKRLKKHPEVQYAIYNSINEVLLLYLPLIKAYPPERITEVVHALLTNKNIVHPKPIIELLRMVFQQKIPLEEVSEENILRLLKRAHKNLEFEYRGEFWNILRQFVEMPTQLDKSKIVEPFLKDLREQFRQKSSLSPEVSIYVESLVNFVWELEILDEKQKSKFY